MSEPIFTQLKIEIAANDATEEDIDQMTRRLLSELRELEVESAELSKGEPAPKGSKGDPITVGSIALEVLPVAIPSVVALVQAWIARGQGLTVKFKSKGISSSRDLRKNSKSFWQHLKRGKRKDEWKVRTDYRQHRIH